MMKWNRLQINALPIIAIQADSAIERLNELIHRISIYASYQDIEALNNLKESIINRIQALDRFYEQNYLDSTISIFHMIKLKLKRAIFKIHTVSNDTISIQTFTQSNRMETENNSRVTEPGFRKNQDQRTLKIQLMPKSRSSSKYSSKENILKLLETSRHHEEEETNLMEGVDFPAQQSAEHSFDIKREYEPLFQAKTENSYQKYEKSKVGQSSIQKMDKNSKSPFSKKEKNNVVKNINRSKSPIRQNEKILSKGVGKGTTTSNRGQKKGAKEKGGQKELKKTKTEVGQIHIQEEKKEEMGQFRFTIKMTKQDYANLLKMKEMLKSRK